METRSVLPSLNWRVKVSVKSEPAFVLDEAHDRVDPVSGFQVREDERPYPAHLLGVTLHHLKRRSDVGRKIDLVDHQQVGASDAGAALGGDLVASRHVI